MKVIGIIILLISGILFPGIISIVKAKTAGRKPPFILQPFFDVVRYFRKGSIYSNITSLIFQLAPLVYFSSVVIALLFLPVIGYSGIFSFENDFVFFAYILGIGKFFMIIAAMDTGSGFEGMGANREAFYSMLIEPAFFLIMGALSLISENTSFYGIFNSLHINTNFAYLLVIAIGYILVFIAMVENSRLPVDDPKTHLELTMVHEVMILDNSGFDMGLIQVAGWLKFVIYGTLITNLIIPANQGWVVQIVSLIGIQVCLAIIIGLLESFRARNKIAKNPQWLLLFSSLAVIVFLAALIITSKIILN